MSRGFSVSVHWCFGLVLVGLLAPAAAEACGCFTPPDPTVPVVQAGERIVFAVWNNQVTAHIQIQYAGDAKDFGWLLPLPSIPKLEIGSDELFQQLAEQTGPIFALERKFDENCFENADRNGGFGPFDGGAFSADLGALGGAEPGGPLVVEDSIGPYDYAVLKADDKKEMLAWLAANRYFVPVGTNDVVSQYTHQGAYFLALKLRSGKSAGDIQPVVVRYASDLPMIPIVLTSVTAQPDMNIWVWLLGDGRAIPRNFYHAVLNNAALDWNSTSAAYTRLVSRAMDEAPRHHAFVTEFAGPTRSVQRGLVPDGFDRLDTLRSTSDARTYLAALRSGGFTFSAALVSILEKHIAMSDKLKQRGISPANYYYNFDYWFSGFGRFRFGFDPFEGVDLSYDAAALTDEIDTRIVTPFMEAMKLFDSHPYLTRLYSTLSPEEMTRDPVFSFNPFLDDVGRRLNATLQLHCNRDRTGYGDGTMTSGGFRLRYPNGAAPTALLDAMPAALRIEILRDSGLPELVTDNFETIRRLLESNGGGLAPIPGQPYDPPEPVLTEGSCSVGPPAGGTSRPWLAALPLALLLGGLLLLRARRRR